MASKIKLNNEALRVEVERKYKRASVAVRKFNEWAEEMGHKKTHYTQLSRYISEDYNPRDVTEIRNWANFLGVPSSTFFHSSSQV